MKLVMDIGNSRMKWARVDPDGLGQSAAANRDEPLETALDAAFADAGAPSAVLVASVADEGFNARLAQWMVDRWGRPPERFRCAPEALGVVNGYQDVAQLGADRWAAVLGACGLHAPPLGVIDCGTAVTLDVVDADNQHLGGLIAPGLALAQRSLLTNTASVRAAARRATGLLGRSTAECVANGTSLGLAGAIERWMRDVEESLEGVTWLATGGSWPWLRATIHGSVQYDPDLVLRGLARVLK